MRHKKVDKHKIEELEIELGIAPKYQESIGIAPPLPVIPPELHSMSTPPILLDSLEGRR